MHADNTSKVVRSDYLPQDSLQLQSHADFVSFLSPNENCGIIIQKIWYENYIFFRRSLIRTMKLEVCMN